MLGIECLHKTELGTSCVLLWCSPDWTKLVSVKIEEYVVISVKYVSVRCQDDIFSRIELFPSNVLSSEKTNYKTDIQ